MRSPAAISPNDGSWILSITLVLFLFGFLTCANAQTAPEETEFQILNEAGIAALEARQWANAQIKFERAAALAEKIWPEDH